MGLFLLCPRVLTLLICATHPLLASAIRPPAKRVSPHRLLHPQLSTETISPQLFSSRRSLLLALASAGKVLPAQSLPPLNELSNAGGQGRDQAGELPPAAPERKIVYTPPAVKGKSSAEAIALARHLKARGARMYGAYWCSHCYGQKEAFGQRGAALIEYVECAEDGYLSRRALCRVQDIKGYPTWEIGGEYYGGERSLEELAEISGFVMPTARR